MMDRVKRSLRDWAVDPGTQELIVAVSGGVDSMVLLHVLQQLDFKLQVAHVDHGLRGAESDADRALVERTADTLGLPIHSHRLLAASLKEGRGSLQMNAREARYAWFGHLLDRSPNAMLAMAHHRDDAIETFLMGLLRGAGLKGLAGLPGRRDRIIRPLIDVGREEILAYATANGVEYREDPSNQDPKYLRNRVRHELLPLLEALEPGVRKNLKRRMQLTMALAEVGQAQMTDLVDARTIVEADRRVIDLSDLDEAQRLLILMHAFSGSDLHPDRLDQINEAIREARSGAMFDLGEAQVLVDRQQLVIHRPKHAHASHITIGEDLSTPPGSGLTLQVIRPEGVDLPTATNVAWLNLDALQFPLVFRTWQAGDRMRPWGMEGSKLISDMLIDSKVARDLKARVRVLCTKDKIIWLEGHRIAEGHGVTTDTKRVLRLEVVADS